MNEPGLDATVLIPSYNSKNTLIPCIEQLTRQTCPADRFEVIVVLDGSTDGSSEDLRRTEDYYMGEKILRPLIIHRRLIGNVVLSLLQIFLETARGAGLRWRVLSAIQGVIGDSLYFRGVYDAIGSQERFNAFIQSD